MKVKIIDFGFSEYYNPKSEMFKGSINYMSPQILGKENYDGKKADIFALGVTLFCLITGNQPF